MPQKVFAQDNDKVDSLRIQKPLVDTLGVASDSLKVSIPADTVKKRNMLQDLVHATAEDSIVYSIDGQKIFLYGQAKVVYQELELKAGYMEIDYVAKQMFARGVPDSTGTATVEKPEFKEGSETYKMDIITYNFETKKAKVTNIITQQGDGFLHSESTKIMPDKTINVSGGKYTTCDLDHPHFYMKMNRAKMLPKPDSKVIFDFSYMVIEDVPTPLFLPFGYFPQVSDRSSGLLFPTFGEDMARGFAVEGLGYYFVFGEYVDLALTFDYFSLGSWGIHANSRYTKRYKFNGGFNMDIAKVVMGDKGSVDYFTSNMFNFAWNHSQAPEVNPTSRFSANVNFSTAAYGKFNANTAGGILQAQTQSSVNYSKNWEDTPFSFSTSLNHSQNNHDSTYNIGFPQISFNMNKVAPFKSKNTVGKGKLYEQIAVSYMMDFKNRIQFKESEWGTPDFFKKFNNGMLHNFAVTLPTFSILKYLTLAPSVSYGQSWFFQSKQFAWNPAENKVDTISSDIFSEFNFTHEYSFSAGFNTRVYGVIQSKNKNALIRAARHVLTPNFSFTYKPDTKSRANGWRTYQYNARGDVREYNIFSGQSAPVRGSSEAASVNFSLENQLEFKVRNRKDTTENGGTTKLKLLESFNMNTSYNFLADSLRLSDITFFGRSNILDKFSFNFGFTLDPYEVAVVDEQVRRVDRFFWTSNRPLALGWLKRFFFACDYTISGGQGKGVESTPISHGEALRYGISDANPHGYTLTYVDFDVPWSVSLDLRYDWSKSHSYDPSIKELVSVVKPSTILGARGDVSLTKNWKVNVSSGYDFSRREISFTQFSLHRDLHCFEFNFSWIPIGLRQSWNFGINIKGSALRDVIKYDERNSFYDNRFIQK